MKRKSVREVLERPLDNEYYVLVTRFYPMELRKRAVKFEDSPFDVWDRDLAPSKELLKDLKNGKIGWKGYKERFKEEVSSVLIREKLAAFEEEAEGKDVVLVCVEKEREYPKCHTWIILEDYEAYTCRTMKGEGL